MLCHLALRLVSSVLLAAQLMWQIFHWAEDCGSARPEKYAGCFSQQHGTGCSTTLDVHVSLACVFSSRHALFHQRCSERHMERREETRKCGWREMGACVFMLAVLITIWHFKHYATVRHWNAGHVGLVHPLEFNSDSLAEKVKLSLATTWWFDLFKEWIIV